jgi:hypothetical protein
LVPAFVIKMAETAPAETVALAVARTAAVGAPIVTAGAVV